MALIVEMESALACEPLVNPLTQAALHGITRALASVGRAFICLDPSFRIVHVSNLLNEFLGDGVAAALRGRPIEELLGTDLFGPAGQLRQALLAGQMREGWRATLKFGNSGPRLVSITTAPVLADNSGICDPLVRYLILLRPADEEEDMSRRTYLLLRCGCLLAGHATHLSAGGDPAA